VRRYANLQIGIGPEDQRPRAWPASRPPAAPSADANLETGAPALASLVPVARDGRTCALTSVDLHPVRPPAIRVRVQMARERQTARFKGTRVHCNAEMSSRQLRKYCGLGVDGQALLQRAVDQLGLSARAYDRILK